MKKIMFNDKYGLTQAVLEGRKTNTRRIAYDFRKHVNHKVFNSVLLPSGNITYMDGKVQVLDEMPKPHYMVGEEVAVAQSYSDVVKDFHEGKHNQGYFFDAVEHRAGWNNKMFVKAELMPHTIKITNVRVERLQDISEEDCLNEGLGWRHGIFYVNYNKETGSRINLGNDYRNAFAALIDRVSGKGTWESNPWVFVYDFELIK